MQPLVFAALPFQLLDLPTLAFQFCLVGIELPVLIGLLDFLPLELIADQSPTSESKRAADGSPGTGMTDRCADNAAGSSTAQGANAGALLTCRQATPGTAQS
jgi:hypothetical protein